MNRETKISLLSKFREKYYQNLPDNKGINILKLLIDIINDDMKGIYQSNKRLSDTALQIHLQVAFDLEISLKDINKYKSLKKQILIPKYKPYYEIVTDKEGITRVISKYYKFEKTYQHI
jgi:hypothetical protein